MGDFWYAVKFSGTLDMVAYPGVDYEVKDAFSKVDASFGETWIVVVYVISMIVLAIHLWQGFQSAFQTLGIRHQKYTPAIEFIGKVYSILVPIGFAFIPIYMYFNWTFLSSLF